MSARVEAGVNAGVKAGVNAGVNAGVKADVNAGVHSGVNAGVHAAPNTSELHEVVPARQFGWRKMSVVTCPASPLLRRGSRAEAAAHLLSASEMVGSLPTR